MRHKAQTGVFAGPPGISSLIWAVERGCAPMCARERGEAKHKLGLPHQAKGSADSRGVPQTTPSWEADPNKLPRGWPVVQFPILPCPRFPGAIPARICAHTPPPSTPPFHARPIHELNQERQRASATHQRKVIRVNPDNAQVRIIGVVPGNLLQDFQELKTI